METGRSDTERRAFPGLATANSVFAWTGATPQTLLVRVGVAPGGGITDTINFRTNTATAGTSIDVPTWAAGAFVLVAYTVLAMGTSTYIYVDISSKFRVSLRTFGAVAPGGLGEQQQLIVPFFDEPVMTVTSASNGTGTISYSVLNLGFVRNV